MACSFIYLFYFFFFASAEYAKKLKKKILSFLLSFLLFLLLFNLDRLFVVKTVKCFLILRTVKMIQDK